MFKKLFSRLFSSKTKGLFTFERHADHSNDLQQAEHVFYSENGERLLFIDGRLSENELRAIYGDALDGHSTTAK